QLFANLSELSPDNLLELDMADYEKLQKAYQDFLS
ncbi:phage tail assembly protein, partial [Oleiphilus sp. HI0132]